MIQKQIDLNCKDTEYFIIEFDNDNFEGVTKDQDMFSRWLRDLRSGKYTQLRGELFSQENETSYCTLGMLCKKKIRRLRQTAISDNINEIVEEVIEHREDYFNNITIYTKEGYKFDIVSFIYELNDFCNLSFNVISDIIEAIHNAIKGKDVSEFEIRLKNQSGWELSAI